MSDVLPFKVKQDNPQKDWLEGKKLPNFNLSEFFWDNYPQQY